jgi:hypothetical protein
MMEPLRDLGRMVRRNFGSTPTIQVQMTDTVCLNCGSEARTFGLRTFPTRLMCGECRERTPHDWTDVEVL